MRFPDGVSQRLLTIHVLAARHGPHGSGAVHVIGAGDGDGIDILGFFIEHLAEIFVVGRLGEF